MGSMWVSCGFKGFPRVWEMAAVGQKEFLGDFKGLQDISERYRVHGRGNPNVFQRDSIGRFSWLLNGLQERLRGVYGISGGL